MSSTVLIAQFSSVLCPVFSPPGYFACAHRNGSNACSSHVYRAAAAVQQLLRSLPTSNHVNVMIPVDNIIQRFINFSPFHLTTLSDVRTRRMRLRTNVSCRRLFRSDRRISAVLPMIREIDISPSLIDLLPPTPTNCRHQVYGLIGNGRV